MATAILVVIFKSVITIKNQSIASSITKLMSP